MDRLIAHLRTVSRSLTPHLYIENTVGQTEEHVVWSVRAPRDPGIRNQEPKEWRRGGNEEK